jgi:hypothetical protein
MIKRWMVLLIVLALSLQACSFPVAEPTLIPSQPTEAVPTSAPEVTIEATTVSPTESATNTATPVSPAPTFTPVPPAPTQKIATPVPVVPTQIPMKYTLQPGTPLALTGFVHADLGCNWMGVGGQVFAQDSSPVKQLVIELGGNLNGQPVSQLSLTGAAIDWGPGGYEFTLSNQPIDSSGTLWLRALDLNGKPISDKIYFTTYNDCAKNAILINLSETNPALQKNYLPIIGR